VFLLLSFNGPEQNVAYSEGDYPSLESAKEAAAMLRAQFPHQSAVVREGWFSHISVVEASGDIYSPSLYRI